MNNPEIIAAIVSMIGAVGAALVAGIRMLFKKIEEYLKELRPNGGSSIKDQVNRLEGKFTDLNNQMAQAEVIRKEMDKKIDMIYKLLIDHINKGQ
jgi:flagellar hook-associated protein FlgK